MTERKIYKLLLVDDDALTREIYKNLFSKEFDVVIAASGNEALQLLEKNFYHAVVTDINMPEMSGVELAKKIRSLNTSNKRIIIVGVTATPHSFYGEAFSAGIAKLFAKPTEFPEIQAYLKNAFLEQGY
jgi:CheY-like chemotaxis protein